MTAHSLKKRLPYFLTPWLVTAGIAHAQTADTPDWADIARSDLNWAHQHTMANHPGAVNTLDPEFVPRAEAALAASLELTDRVNSYAGYDAILDHYTAAFRDGHFGVSGTLRGQGNTRWPGIALAWREDRGFVVAGTSENLASLLDYTLNACSSVDANALMERRVFAYSNGKPDQPAYWMTQANRLLLETGNPLLPSLGMCTLSKGNMSVFFVPDWQPLTTEFQDTRRRTTGGGLPDLVTALREVEPGYFWVNLPDFSPNNEEVDRLHALFAEVRARRDELRNAELLVLDMRNNSGGNSEWGLNFAQALWGNGYVHAVAAEDMQSPIDWRASQTNIDFLKSIVPRFTEQGQQNLIDRWLQPNIDGMEQALASGQPLFREIPIELPEFEDQTDSTNPVNTKVLLLTHPWCGSSCLNFADIALKLGAIQVGAPTSSDTLYMDVREQELPSGNGAMYVPMKVYRERDRGDGDFYSPEIQYHGLDWSTEAVEAWINEIRATL